MRHLFGVLVLTAAAAVAQNVVPMPEVQPPSFGELKTYLGLDDAQLQQLRQITSSFQQSNMSLYSQIAAKHQIIEQQLRADNPDGVAAGNAVVAIAGLRKQLDTAEAERRRSASGVLTPEQRVKLATLENARKLYAPIGQAEALGLLEVPKVIPLTGRSLPASEPGQPVPAPVPLPTPIPCVTTPSGDTGPVTPICPAP